MRASEAYARLGLTARTVRKWEVRGWVPYQGAGRHRRYTERQIELMLQLKRVIQRWARYRREYRPAQAQISRSITMVHRRWTDE